jgi:UDP-glucose 4-epimerase
MNIADDNIKELFSEFNFEIIYHLASQIDLNLSVKDPVSDAETNIIGTLNLLQNSVKFGVRKFIFSSSGGAIYGEQTSFPANESHPAKPQSPYGISKLTVEKYLDFYNNIYGLKYFILRYSNVYGPRQNLNGECGVVSIFCRKILSGKQPLINGDGLQTRDFVYVDDVVNANIMVLDYNESKILNISSGKETTINELYQIISKNYGNKFAMVHSPEINPGQQRSVLDNKYALNEFYWIPRTDINEGLSKTCKWFKDYFEN